MPKRSLKPSHRAVKAYYETLAQYGDQHVEHETAVRSAFQTLLADTARGQGWTLIPELSARAANQSRDREGAVPPSDASSAETASLRSRFGSRTIRPDGTLRDGNSLPRGYWEAKDTSDDLDAEIVKKAAKGYSLANTIFEDTRTAVLFQGKREVLRADLHEPQQLCDLLNLFYAYTEPDIADFEQAIGEFKERVPELARGLADIIRDSHDSNPRFRAAFDAFFTLCQTALNPNIAPAAVDEMLIQHLLTERLIRKVFDNPEFTRRNVIAAEVEKVIAALVSRAFDRDEFLRRLDRFYVAIEHAARRCHDWNEKQHFLNTVYERFFQGYSVKVADTHGIVYTPQPIVDFMCASVAEVLQSEFGVSLCDKSVQILDPCTGTGNFIVNLLRWMPKRDLRRMYRAQLFANEVMLLPYYIAALNIEHAYYELTGTYEPFEGLCFVDTLDLAESKQAGFSFMTEKNTQRVERQKKAPITVIIGNPPYNVGQLNENDKNKNRAYPVIDSRIRDTYGRDSRATSVAKIADPYVKFFRWAADRLGERDGVVCFVSNNSFVNNLAFDGMRKHLAGDFQVIYHLDLEGNVRENPELSGTAYNVFGIQVGVGITVAVRRNLVRTRRIRYAAVDKQSRREEKLAWLRDRPGAHSVRWKVLKPDRNHTWLPPRNGTEFARFVCLASKEGRSSKNHVVDCMFRDYGLGVATHRDPIVYAHRLSDLRARISQFIDDYNGEVDRFIRAAGTPDVDEFVRYGRVVWDADLKMHLKRRRYAQDAPGKYRLALYRPFSKKHLFFDELLNARRYGFPAFFPTTPTERENRGIVLSDIAFRASAPSALMADRIADLHLCASLDGHQCFPFYVYDEDGSNRRENITDWALKLFREHYQDPAIEKWDIFYYVYGVLHHPGYREKFADNLKRELPRIPLAPPLPDGRGSDSGATAPGPLAAARGSDRNRDREGADGQRDGVEDAAPSQSRFGSAGGPAATGFWAFSAAGKELTHWHLDYEQVEPYPLKFVEKKTVGPADAVRPGADADRCTGSAAKPSPNPSLGGRGVQPPARGRGAKKGVRNVPMGNGPTHAGRRRTIEDLYRVEDKMRLSKDKTELAVNPLLTLEGIPVEVFEYRLGNRSALEWVIDQHRVTTDKRSGIRSDPNRPDDPEYIVRLVGQVVRVSLETVRIVRGLPERYAE